MMPLAVPILLYHAVDESPPGWIAPYTVKPDVFRRHLDLIASLGCQPLTVTEMAERLQPGRSWPDRPVVITIDDGFADVASVVAPALAAQGFPATLYVTTAALSAGPTSAPCGVGPTGAPCGVGPTGTPCGVGPTGAPHRLPQAAMLRWDQLPALEADGIELGAHTLTHPPLDILPEGMAYTEIKDSKVVLEDALGHPVRSFAYPHGHHDRRVTTLVRHAGFDSACAVKNALSSATDDAFALSRLTVLASTPDGTLEQWLLGSGAPRCSPRRKLRTRAGRQYRRFVAREWQ